MIQNPILPGFNPDPSIVRVGEDYYIATSTFEWFPGVQIHHSRDLANWELVAHPLDRLSQINMIGNKDSGGVWAPCLSWCDGLFHLVYSDVKYFYPAPYKTSHNYLVTAPDVRGPWSEPIYLNSSGFDPSLFHDDDGRKWVVNQLWDHRRGHNPFNGVVLQEYSEKEERLVGEMRHIFPGTELGATEGPHLYRRNGYYYLVTAEGGTGYHHAVTVARSRRIEGPYEVHPQNPMLTSRDRPDAILQKAGHASWTDTPDGTEWYLVHLCGRPVVQGRCTLGRETAIQKMIWRDDDWPELEAGGNTPLVEVPPPAGTGAMSVRGRALQRVNFGEDAIPVDFQSLRRPFEESWISTSVRPGWLRLYGEEPTTSLFRQSLIARRLQALSAEISTSVDFAPGSYLQMAGLIAYYDTSRHYYLRISRDEKAGRSLNIIQCRGASHHELLPVEISIPDQGPVHMKATICRTRLNFEYSLDGKVWTPIGLKLDATILSDEFHSPGFTGCFFGMCCQDLGGTRCPADFRYFHYVELD